MTGGIYISSFPGYRVTQVDAGTIISDPSGKERDVVVDDSTVAVRLGTMFVTEKVFNRLREIVPTAKP